MNVEPTAEAIAPRGSAGGVGFGIGVVGGVASNGAFDVYLEIPDLDDMCLLPGVHVELTALDSSTPRLTIGSVVFAGKFQDIIGTAVAVCAAEGTAAGVAVAAIAAKRIVFELVSGNVGDITAGLDADDASEKDGE